MLANVWCTMCTYVQIYSNQLCFVIFVIEILEFCWTINCRPVFCNFNVWTIMFGKIWIWASNYSHSWIISANSSIFMTSTHSNTIVIIHVNLFIWWETIIHINNLKLVYKKERKKYIFLTILYSIYSVWGRKGIYNMSNAHLNLSYH